MKNDIIRAVIFTVLAVMLFMLPQNTMSRIRLKVYNIFGDVKEVAGSIEGQEGVYDSSVSPRRRVAELTNELVAKDAQILSLKREMRNLINFRNQFPTLEIIPAKVITYRFSDAATEVYISAGKEQGVSRDNILVQAGAYVGGVVMVDEQTSLAVLADSPKSVVAARALRSGDSCIVRGEGFNKAKAIFYVSKTEVVPGEKVITSGFLGKAPEGLVVGVVEDYPVRGSEPGTMEAPVRLEAALSKLEDVLVVGLQTGSKNKPE